MAAWAGPDAAPLMVRCSHNDLVSLLMARSPASSRLPDAGRQLKPSGSLPAWSNGLRFRPKFCRMASASLEAWVTAVALVTGGTGGIGRAICWRLAASDLIVAAGDVDVTAWPQVDGVAGGTIVDFPMDVTEEASVGRYVAAAAALGSLTALVNCAGVLREARSDEMPEGEAAAMWAVNVMGGSRVTRAAIPHLAEGAAIVYIGSIAGAVGRFAGTAMYSASKAAL